MIDSGNTAFMIICSALVLFMTFGLAFFYGGLVRRKNVINTMMMSVSVIAIAVVMWVAFGYSLSFGQDNFGIIGGLDHIGFMGVEFSISDYAPTIPHAVFAGFQMMFAIITPAIITGAVVGRMRFKAVIAFIVLWSLIVYYPLAHMVWGEGGLILNMGAVDFAGGDVVHISSGVSALVLSIMLGKRHAYGAANYRIHNVPFVLLGAGMLCFGWFGFNAGSAYAANQLAAQAMMTTAASAGAAMLSWMALDHIFTGKTTLIGAATGLVVGLVAITPGAGFVPVWASLIIGALGSPVCFFMISTVKHKFGYDDALDAFGCHGIGGIYGGLVTGIFAQTAINGVAQWDGLLYGDYHLFLAQVMAILLTIAIAVVGTVICAKLVSIFVPLRVSVYEEKIGMDKSEHNETAYPSFNGLD